MRGYIANTDQTWFHFLRSEPPQEEVNFWNPSARNTYRGKMGAPFFFRMKSPANAIGGFGLAAWSDRMPEWLAWECFGRGNGAPTLEMFREQIRRLRESSKIQGRDTLDQIGCIILSKPVFFPRDLWIPQPDDWKPQSMRYTGYSLTEGEGLRVFKQCTELAAGLDVTDGVIHEPPPQDRYGTPVLVAPRLGQGTFRLAVTDAYGRACAVTEEHSLPALEAAHIRPYADGGEHDVRNGLLLRSDLHRLFDHGYLTVTPDHRLRVSRQLRDHFSNGRSYYPLEDHMITVPKPLGLRPDGDLLRWHNDHRFRA